MQVFDVYSDNLGSTDSVTKAIVQLPSQPDAIPLCSL